METPGVDAALAAPADSLAASLPPTFTRPRTAVRIFRGTLVYTCILTGIWLYFLITRRDGGLLFGDYKLDGPAIGRIAGGFIVGTLIWGFIWFGIRWLLLRHAAGFSRQELAAVFRSRMNEPFDLAPFLASHSERLIRVIDMAGRRGRFITLGFVYFLFVHNNITANPDSQHFITGLQQGLVDAVAFCWITLAAYYSDGFFGRVVLGAQARLMDGSLARANCLLIGTLWSAFKFVMVPIGIQLTARFPPQTYAALFAFIWITYQASDALSEIVGSLLGKQKLRVWGIGDVNRKSVAGTWACFLGSLAVCLWIISIHHLPLPWYGLALVVSVSNTAFELFSPRGTDDFTMATANALLCWGFGALVY